MQFFSVLIQISDSNSDVICVSETIKRLDILLERSAENAVNHSIDQLIQLQRNLVQLLLLLL